MLSVFVVRYQDLVVWQRAMTLVEEVYAITALLPTKEKYGFTSQLRRAVRSIPANIAEGYGRGQTGDYRRHLAIAIGSVFELQTDLELLVRLQLLSPQTVDGAMEGAREVALMLGSLRRRLGLGRRGKTQP